MKIDQRKFADLATGTIGIYLIYCISSVLQQWIMKQPYTNRFTGSKQHFVNSNAFILIPSLVSWLNGWVLNRNMPKRTVIPKMNLFYTAALIMLSAICFTQAIYVINYPIVMMFKSCNVLSVIGVGIFCSRVREKKHKLGRNKLLSGFFVTVGILVYNIGGSEKHIERVTNPWGIGLLVISLVCDGFFPDFQAEIKEKYKPSPLEFFEDTNRWKFYISGFYGLVTLQLIPVLVFFWEHPICLVHMLVLSQMGAIGQMLVFWMIKLFRQHTVPFIITTRKIASVLISILFFGHEFKVAQLIGILVVFLTVVFDFSAEITKQHTVEVTALTERIQNAVESEKIMADDDNEDGDEDKDVNLLK